MADRGFPSYDLYVDTRPPEQTCSGVSRRPSPCPSSPAWPTAPTSRNCAAKARNSGSPSASPEYSIRDDDGTSEVFALITNLLDPDDAPALELARNYSERWHIELLFRLRSQDPRRDPAIPQPPRDTPRNLGAAVPLPSPGNPDHPGRPDRTTRCHPDQLPARARRSQRLRRPGFSPLITWPPPSNSSSPTLRVPINHPARSRS
jgi:hypothetical protein